MHLLRGGEEMTKDSDFHRDFLRLVPDLRAFARSLARNVDVADDLVQETLLKAWEKRASLRDRDKLKPWLLMILRNIFLQSLRRTRNEVEDSDGIYAQTLALAAPQDAISELTDVMRAMDTLPRELREALVLICVEQLSYDEAAAVCGCPVGTLKSRVNRARARLATLIETEPAQALSRQPQHFTCNKGSARFLKGATANQYSGAVICSPD